MTECRAFTDNVPCTCLSYNEVDARALDEACTGGSESVDK